MEEWKEYRLGDIATIKGGKRLPKGINLIKAPNNHPYIRVQDLGHEKTLELNSSYAYVDDETQKFISKYIVNTGDIIMSIVGTIGLIGIVGNTLNNANLTENCVKVVNVSNIEKEYLYYFLISTYGQSEISKGIVGAVQLKLPIKNIQNISIKAPNLIIQKKISNILQSLDEKIELNRRINENLEQQAQALFKSWFVDFEPFKDGKFVDSELGLIPKGWKVGFYTELVDIKGGGTPKTEIKEYWNGNIPFFSPKDIGSSCFILDTEKYITANGLENCNSNLFPPYTVFITARGTVGKVVMSGCEMAMNQTNYALLGKHNISQYYVYLITLQLATRLLKKANGAVFNAITTRDFTSEQIIIPFDSVIKDFSSIVRPIYENILLNEFQIKTLSQLRDTILFRLMSGELKIK